MAALQGVDDSKLAPARVPVAPVPALWNCRLTPGVTPGHRVGARREVLVIQVELKGTASAAFNFYLDYQDLSSGTDTVGVTPGVSLQFHNAGTGATGTRAGLDFEIVNASGAAIDLSNYRIRYFLYDPSHVGTTDHQAYAYSDGTGAWVLASLVAYPTYTGGPRDANMEVRLAFGSYSLGRSGPTCNGKAPWAATATAGPRP